MQEGLHKLTLNLHLMNLKAVLDKLHQDRQSIEKQLKNRTSLAPKQIASALSHPHGPGTKGAHDICHKPARPQTRPRKSKTDRAWERPCAGLVRPLVRLVRSDLGTVGLMVGSRLTAFCSCSAPLPSPVPLPLPLLLLLLVALLMLLLRLFTLVLPLALPLLLLLLPLPLSLRSKKLTFL